MRFVKPYQVFVLFLVLVGCSTGRATVTVQPNSVDVAPGAAMRWNFDADSVNSLPKNMTVFSGTWLIRTEANAPSSPNALCQTGNAEFPALSLSDSVYQDFKLTAQVKPISGQSDQAAGLIFHIQDKNNYYILRANALEGNVNLYKYAGGQRSTIKEGSASVQAGKWQELQVEVVGNRLRGFLNGQLVVEATDDTYKVGGVGLWTKADSVTCFDDVEVSPA